MRELQRPFERTRKDVGSQDDKALMCEVYQTGGVVDQCVFGGDERVDAAHRDRGYKQL